MSLVTLQELITHTLETTIWLGALTSFPETLNSTSQNPSIIIFKIKKVTIPIHFAISSQSREKVQMVQLSTVLYFYSSPGLLKSISETTTSPE